MTYEKQTWIDDDETKPVNAARLNHIEDGIALATPLSDPTGVLWSPDGWREKITSTLKEASDRKVKIVGWGDSIMEGYFTGNRWQDRWWRKMNDALQTKYGDGGSGPMASSYSKAALTGNIWGYNPANEPIQTISGGVTPYTGLLYNFQYLVLDDGAVIETTVRGRFIDVYAYRDTTLGSIDVQLDSGVATNHSLAGAASELVVVVDALTEAEHIVRITSHGLNVLSAIGAHNSKGIWTAGWGYAGRKAGDGIGSPAYTSGPADSAAKISITDFDPDLFILSLGVNDFGATSLDDYDARLSYWLQKAREGNGDGHLLIVTEHIGSMETAYTWQRYVARAQAVASAFGAAHLNLWASGRSTYEWMNNFGYWGDNTIPGVAGSDPVHPSNAGSVWMGNLVANILMG